MSHPNEEAINAAMDAGMALHDWHMMGNSYVDAVEETITTALEAAMPHIREQIVKEIADFRDNLPQNDSEKWLANEIRKAKAQGWAEGITASGINLDWQLHLLDHNPYTEES